MDGWSWPSISEWCLKTSQSSLGAELCRRKRTDLEAVNTQEMNRNKCGGERESDGERKDESDSEPDIHTRNPTLIVSDQFSICYTDQFMDLGNESQYLLFIMVV